MAYLKTNEEVRAYKAKMDSNAAQFARAGNPWDGEGQTRTKVAKPKVPKPGPVKAYVIPRSEADEVFEATQCALNMRARIKAHYAARQRAAEPIAAPARRPFILRPNNDPEHRANVAARQRAVEAEARARREAQAAAQRAAVMTAQFNRLAEVMAEAMAD